MLSHQESSPRANMAISRQESEEERLHEKQVKTDLTPNPTNHSSFQPYRNTTMVLAEPKTIHQLREIENKFVTASGEPVKSAYRWAIQI